MPSFVYTARDGAGLSVTGVLAADSASVVSQMLRADGKYPTDIRPTSDTRGGNTTGSAPGISSAGIKLGRAEVIQLSTQLAIMLETGVTLSEALGCIAQQSERPDVRKLVADLSQQVQGGTDFSAALARHPRSFPRLYVALIKASEKSGMMAKLLNRATAYLRDEAEIVRKVRGALTYPLIMFGFACTTTIFLLAFVLPRFTAIYANKGAALPTPTKILMAASSLVVGNWPALLVGVGVSVIGLILFLRTSRGQRTWHFVQLRIPLVGGIYRKLHLSRGLRMVGTMSGSGVHLVDCVTTAHDLCDNTYFRDLWGKVSEQIQSGKQLSEPLFQSNLVPRSIAQMLSSAEKSGKLAQVMEQVAGFSEQELKEKIAEMTRYIEPIMIVAMGGIIGGVALALLLPIFSISKVMAH